MNMASMENAAVGGAGVLGQLVTGAQRKRKEMSRQLKGVRPDDGEWREKNMSTLVV